MFQLKKHKMNVCEAQLRTIGLNVHEAKDAARLWGGDLENATDWYLESKACDARSCTMPSVPAAFLQFEWSACAHMWLLLCFCTTWHVPRAWLMQSFCTTWHVPRAWLMQMSWCVNLSLEQHKWGGLGAQMFQQTALQPPLHS